MYYERLGCFLVAEKTRRIRVFRGQSEEREEFHAASHAPDARATLATVLAFYESARTGKTVGV